MYISQCRLENGYNIKELHLQERHVIFVLAAKGKNGTNVVIPDAIRYGHVPDDAKYEPENYFS